MSSGDGVKETLGCLILLTAFAGSCAWSAATDEMLVDPTRPLEMLSGGAGVFGDGAGSPEFGTGAAGVRGGLFAGYELSSVLIRGDNRIAVINEQRVREGDSIGNAKVAVIEADRVTLNMNGEIRILELYENSIKTLVKGDDR